MHCSLEGILFYDVHGCVLKVGDHKNKVTLRRVLYDLLSMYVMPDRTINPITAACFCWQEVNTNWLVSKIDLVTIK